MQSATRYTFTVRDLPTPWIVRKVDLHESLSQPYALTLELVTSALDLNPAVLLGADCRLTLAHSPGPQRTVHGLVLRVETLDHDDHLRHLRLEIGPALALLAHQTNTRLWQHTSVPDIIKDVLEDSLTAHGRRLRLDLAATYPPRETCTQYRESDLEFVQRILHEEGIAFAFDHDDDSEILLILDDNTRCPLAADLPFIPRGSDIAESESIERLDPARTLGPTSLIQRGWSPLHAADAPFEHDRLSQDDRGRHRTLFDHDDQRTDNNDLAVRARRKLEQHTMLATAATGLGTALGLAPGRRFDLSGHPDPTRDGRWLLLDVTHHGEVPDADRLADNTAKTPTYSNHFTCVPDTTKLRPPHNPSLRRPRVHGPHTAIVVGPEGEEIHTDEHGRIRVRFHWDRTLRRGDDCSCWVPVAQTWAGPGWGALFIPRVGMEVVVQFLDGDPDRPLVIGCVPNSLNITAVPLPDCKTLSALTSESTPGGGLANQILLEDARGRESLTVHTCRDLRTHAGHNHNADIINNLTTKVGHNYTTTVGANQTTTVTGNYILTVSDGDLNTKIAAGSRDTVIHGIDSTIVSTGGTFHRTSLGVHFISAQKTISLVSTLDDICLTAGQSVQLEAENKNLLLHGKEKVELSSSNADLALSAETCVRIAASKEDVEITAERGTYIKTKTGNIRIKAGGEATLRSAGQTKVQGDTVLVNADTSIELRVGNSAIVISPTGIEISAPAITSTAIGHYVVQGAMIRLN